jgi:flagellar biosynthesis/type III secretory pathway ATPase
MRGRGRPRGKRSDPNYEQISAYIAKKTHLEVKIALLQEGRGREFSELVEELLGHWLKTR